MDINICEHCHKTDCIFKNESEGQTTCANCGLVYSSKKEKGKNKIIKINQKNTKIDSNHNKIRNYLSNLGVRQSVIETALSLYYTIAPYINLKGKKFTHIIAALYYYALLVNKTGHSYKQVAELFPSIKERDIKKAANSIKNYISEDIVEDELTQIEKNLIMFYFLNDMEPAQYDVKMLSIEIIQNINDNDLLEGIKPEIVAGLSLLLSFKLLNEKNSNEEEFYKVFSNKASISKSFEKIKASLDKIIPQKYSDKIVELENKEI